MKLGNNKGTFLFSREKLELIILVLLPTIFVAVISGLKISQSIWVDESVMITLLKYAAPQQIENFLKHSPSYFYLSTFISNFWEASIFSLRIQSSCYILLASIFVYFIAEIITSNKKIAATAAIFFVTSNEATFQIANIRPYALGILFSSISALYFLKYIATSKSFWGILAILLAYLAHGTALTFFHLPIIYFIFLCGYQRKLVKHFVVISLLVFSIGNLQRIYQIVQVFENRATQTFAKPPTIDYAFFYYLDTHNVLIYTLLFLYCLALFFQKTVLTIDFTKIKADAKLMFILLLAIIPAATNFMAATIFDTQIYVQRYFITTSLGTSILLALLCQPLKKLYRTVLITLVCVSPFIVLLQTERQIENWQLASEYLTKNNYGDNHKSPILIYTGFTENDFPELVFDHYYSDYFNSPIIAYNNFQNIYPIPNLDLEYQDELSIKKAIDPLILPAERVALVQRWKQDSTIKIFDETTWEAEKVMTDFGSVQITIFKKRS